MYLGKNKHLKIVLYIYAEYAILIVGKEASDEPKVWSVSH